VEAIRSAGRCVSLPGVGNLHAAESTGRDRLVSERAPSVAHSCARVGEGPAGDGQKLP
jgi:hypothetical protein